MDGPARAEWERLKVRIPEIEARLREMDDGDVVWSRTTIAEREALDVELEQLRKDWETLERFFGGGRSPS